MDEKFTPNCRYGHGDLQKLQTVFGGEWGLVSSTLGVEVLFTGDLYICATCGYTELFDPEPQKTVHGVISQRIPPQNLDIAGKAE
jgi:hypothetical protein